jgi:hypothetical protein
MSVHPLLVAVPALCSFLMKPLLLLLLLLLWHLLQGLRSHPSHSTPDILPSPGDKTWTRGMGTAACAAACQYILQHTTTRTVVDPFCGHGTVLAVANALGLNAVGVELSAKRARQARQLKVDGGLQKCLKGGASWRGRGGKGRRKGGSVEDAQQQQQQQQQGLQEEQQRQQQQHC